MSSDHYNNTPIIMAHEAEIMLPGPFVVFQGIPGDGMANTVDNSSSSSLSIFSEQESSEEVSDEEFMHVRADDSSCDDSSNVVVVDDKAQNNNTPLTVSNYGASTLLLSQSVVAAIPPTAAAFGRGGQYCYNPLTARPPPPRPDESFIVVSDGDNNATTTTTNNIHYNNRQLILTPAQQEAIYTWQTDCRNKERQQRHDWLLNNNNSNNNDDESCWWQEEGHLCVFRNIPTKSRAGLLERTVLTTLSPGSTVVATKLYTLDSTTLKTVRTTTSSKTPQQGLTQILQLESPSVGYVVLSRNGYLYLGPGLPSLYLDPQVWIWRITCAAGAFVRQGLELNSHQVGIIPYGSLCRVTRKTVNSQGLSRLLVHYSNTTTTTHLEGWISEFLNPLSGQRGFIAQPMPFPVPALYKVQLQEGAVIRSGVELSSRQIGVARKNSVLSVIGRAFSEHPADQCLERLKLAGNGGWVSVRLNKPRPQDQLVMELVGMDGSFDPDHAGLFHLEAQERVKQQQVESEQSSSFDTTTTRRDDNAPTISRSGFVPPEVVNSAHNKRRTDERCLICLTEERNATIVHGETGHIACCLVCARILKARGDKCPVCRLPIDSVIQQFWA